MLHILNEVILQHLLTLLVELIEAIEEQHDMNHEKGKSRYRQPYTLFITVENHREDNQEARTREDDTIK